MAKKQPASHFSYKIEWNGANLLFSEISSIKRKDRLFGTRHSGSKNFSKIKMPGMRKYTNIVLKRGTFKSDSGFQEWLEEVSNPDRKKSKLILQLVNEKNEILKTWFAKNSFPVKVQAPDLKAGANEVNIESIEITHDGLKLRHRWRV